MCTREQRCGDVAQDCIPRHRLGADEHLHMHPCACSAHVHIQCICSVYAVSMQCLCSVYAVHMQCTRSSVYAAIGADADIDADCKGGSGQPQSFDLRVEAEVGPLQAHLCRAPVL